MDVCNAEVIDVNLDKLGKQGRSVLSKVQVEVWQKSEPN